jgi:ribosomal protein S18 acetylase RimI-like enzyme
MIVSKGISAADRNSIEEILRSSGFFYDFEIEIALGIADETIKTGSEDSGYYWMKITDNDEVIAFANYVKDAFSVHSWDLYWLAVHQKLRNKKVGSLLLDAVEDDIRKSGGKILWLDTAGRSLYAPTEAFYRSRGYLLQASLKDFYSTGDPKQIYAKNL